MQNKIIKIAALTLLSAFALTACNDDIIAKPAGYGDNSPVVTITDGGNDVSVYNNKFDDIYDAIRSGSIPSDVLDTLLYQYAMSVFGNYNEITVGKVTDNQFGNITLKQAVAGLTQTGGQYSGSQATNDFIKAHEAYWNKDKNGNRVKDDFKTPASETDDPTQAEYARLDSKWKTIEKRIAQKLYSEISGGSYSEENVFYELKYLRSLANSIENNVIAITDAVKSEAFKGVLTSKVEDYDIFDETKGKTEDLDGNKNFILHREFYQSNSGLNETEKSDQDATYVEDHIIPDIYRQLLVEQYLLDESYDTLGRTSARHISVLSISNNTAYAKGAFELMNTFVSNYIFDETRDDDLETEADNITLDTFKIASEAWIGAFMSKDGYENTDQYKLLDEALPDDYFEGTVGNPGAYFKGTAYGDMMEQYEKINDNPKISENESTYTGSNSYTKEVGKEIKTRELELQDHTSTGWYIKSVGVSTLPDSLKNQLFDINVANALDGRKCVEYTYEGGEWKTNEDEANLINVVGKINGQYFLRKTSRVKDVPVESDVLFESDGTYYIVLVEDAIRSINLSKSSYVDANAKTLEKLEGYINEIVQIVGNNDTYKNLSKKHWLEEMNIKYHDTEVYNYFKSNFPDLFD
ncbi:MAG: hypothetical protein IJR08_02260 [Bacilli bacterium]|nr:hypothetical protein [Bacilli bacterium]